MKARASFRRGPCGTCRTALFVLAGSGLGFVLQGWGAHAQEPMGTVATHDARVSGGLEVQGERARLLSNTSITAYDHTASISLERGGEVLVCSTSQFHLLHSGTGQSLLFGLDRGAIELHTASQDEDIILTPDIRFTLEHKGNFDLRLRVTPNGDTCVDNQGVNAPVLELSDPFSSTTYRLIPGQHVLFEHGNLHEVVDKEHDACGCPVAAAPTVLSADATPAEKAAAAHPFPAAVSEGLAQPEPMANTAPVGQETADVSSTFTYQAGTTSASAAVSTPAAPTVSTAPPPSPPGAHDIVHAIGHFFHKLFHPHSSSASGDTPANP